MQLFDTSKKWDAVLKAGLECDSCLQSIATQREQEARLWGSDEDARGVERALNAYAKAIAKALKQLLPILSSDAESYYEASSLLQRLYENRQEDAVRRCRVIPRIESYRDLRRTVLQGITVGPLHIIPRLRLELRGSSDDGLDVAAIWGRLGVASASRDPITAVRIERLDQQLREARKTKGGAE